MEKDKPFLLRDIPVSHVSKTRLIVLLTSFINFFIIVGAVFVIGMGLGDSNTNSTIIGIALILTFLIFSSPLFIVSYLIGRFSKNKTVSAWSYALWAIIGILPYPFIMRNALSPISNTVIVMGFVILVFATITYLGVSLGYKKK